MKENIRVVVRIRPEEKVNSCVEDYANLLTISSKHGNSNTVDEHAFKFDQVFGQEASQKNIFDHVESFVSSAINGYNSTIFAFGMTGSGKTHTITGEGAGEHAGVVPRTVEFMFEEVERKNKENPNEVVIVYLSCIELYNNVLHDLLESRATAGNHTVSIASLNYKPTPLKLFEHPVKGVSVSGTSTLRSPVTTPQEAMEFIKYANSVRAHNSTLCNERSSRSHSVYTFELLSSSSNNGVSGGINQAGGATAAPNPVHSTAAPTIIRHSCLNLVDLAGSEDVRKSGATGETLEEAKSINKSLAILGDVLNALSRQHQHQGPDRPPTVPGTNTNTSASAGSGRFVPYRSSKLTMLLKDSLGGNSKTLMIATVRPGSGYYHQTLSTLRYAARTRDIVCTPRLNMTLYGNNSSGNGADSGHGASTCGGASSGKVHAIAQKNTELTVRLEAKENEMREILAQVRNLQQLLTSQGVECSRLQALQEANKSAAHTDSGAQENFVEAANADKSGDDSVNAQQIEELQEKNRNETAQLKQQLTALMSLQSDKLMTQAKEFQTSLGLERNRVSKTMLELTKEKATAVKQYTETKTVIIPELQARISTLAQENEDLVEKNKDLEEQVQTLEGECQEERQQLQDVTNSYEAEKGEWVAMIAKLVESRNRYKEQCAGLKASSASGVGVGVAGASSGSNASSPAPSSPDVAALEDQLCSKDARIVQLQVDLAASQAERERYQEDLGTHATFVQQLAAKRLTYKATIERLSGELRSVSTSRDEALVAHGSLAAELAASSQGQEALQASILELQAQVAGRRQAEELAAAQHREALDRCTTLEETVVGLEREGRERECVRREQEAALLVQIKELKDEGVKQMSSLAAAELKLAELATLAERAASKMEYEHGLKLDEQRAAWVLKEQAMGEAANGLEQRLVEASNDIAAAYDLLTEEQQRTQSSEERVAVLEEECRAATALCDERGRTLKQYVTQSEQILTADSDTADATLVASDAVSAEDGDATTTVTVTSAEDGGGSAPSSFPPTPVALARSTEASTARMEELETKVCQLMMANAALEERCRTQADRVDFEKQLSSSYVEDLGRARREHELEVRCMSAKMTEYLQQQIDRTNSKKIASRSLKVSKLRDRLDKPVNVGSSGSGRIRDKDREGPCLTSSVGVGADTGGSNLLTALERLGAGGHKHKDPVEAALRSPLSIDVSDLTQRLSSLHNRSGSGSGKKASQQRSYSPIKAHSASPTPSQQSSSSVGIDAVVVSDDGGDESGIENCQPAGGVVGAPDTEIQVL